MDKKKCFEIISNNYGKIIGSGIGLIVSILLLTIGFFKTLLLVITVSIGYFIGSKIDKRESITDILDRILPPGTLD